VRNKEVRQQQTKDFLNWKKKKRYGYIDGWMAKETDAFLSIKRICLAN
jgi:hypothetical protein